MIANLQMKSNDLEDMKNMFIKLDTSKDGFLDRDEMEAGMTDILEMFHIEEQDWAEMM